MDLTYAAPPECPGRREVLVEVGRRIDPMWPSGADHRSFVVKIERLTDGTYSGRLEVTHEAREARETRELRGDTCKSVSAALTVFIAIALDPATAEAPPEPTPPTLAPTGAEPSPSSTVTGPAPDSAPAPPPLVPAPVPPHVEAPRASWVWSSGVGVAYLRAPQDGWGARVDARVARVVRGGRIAPALHLSWGFADYDAVLPGGGRASFRLSTWRPAACVLVDLRPVPLVLSPCVGADIGSLSAHSINIPQVGHSSTAWNAATGFLRASWPVLPWLALEGEVGLEAPFTRTAFALAEPVRIVYRPPAVLFFGGAGLAVSARFP